MQTVLLPFDFSPKAQQVYWNTLQLCRQLAAKLVLLHVIPSPTTVVGRQESIDQIGTHADGAYQPIRSRIEAQLSIQAQGVQVELAQGHPTQELIRLSRELRCDLLVLGSQGGIGPRGDFLNEDIQGIIQCVPCPVVILPASPRASPVQHLMYTSKQARELENPLTLLETMRLGQKLGARTSAAYLTTRPEQQWYRLELQRVNGGGLQPVQTHLMGIYHFPPESLETSFQKVIHDLKVDLLVVRRGHLFHLAKVLKPGHPRPSLTHPELPLLVLPA